MPAARTARRICDGSANRPQPLRLLFVHAQLPVSSSSDVSSLDELETYALASASERASLLRSDALRFDEPHGQRLLLAALGQSPPAGGAWSRDTLTTRRCVSDLPT